MSQKEKAFFDPLSGILNSDGPGVNHRSIDHSKSKPTSTIDEPLGLKEIDASKIRFKEKKGTKEVKLQNEEQVQEVIIEKIEAEEESVNTEPIAVEDTKNDQADMWASKQNTASVSIDQLFQDFKHVNIEDDVGMFGSAIPKKSKVNETADTSENLFKFQTSRNDDNSNILKFGNNAAEEDDSNIAELSVGRILEREEDLDFETFGKFSRGGVGAGRGVTKAQPKKPLIPDDDLNVFSLDSLSKLESATKGDSLFALLSSTNTTNSQSDSNAINTDSVAEIDFNNLDSYIAQQSSSSGGGLFD